MNLWLAVAPIPMPPNKSLDASGTSGLVIDNLSVTWLTAAASTQPLGIFLMTIVKQVLGHHVTFGGERHSGWLPQGAAMPKPTPTNDVALNITIESDGAGYLCVLGFIGPHSRR